LNDFGLPGPALFSGGGEKVFRAEDLDALFEKYKQ
jgi:hypothetical protein